MTKNSNQGTDKIKGSDLKQVSKLLYTQIIDSSETSGNFDFIFSKDGVYYLIKNARVINIFRPGDSSNPKENVNIPTIIVNSSDYRKVQDFYYSEKEFSFKAISRPSRDSMYTGLDIRSFPMKTFWVSSKIANSFEIANKYHILNDICAGEDVVLNLSSLTPLDVNWKV